MKLRSLLPRRHAENVPLLPADETGGPPARDSSAENLERLLTPSELDLIRHHKL
ncbi:MULTISPECIES: hypothetical protein [Nocardia]|uniref:Uncharacterized protein n=1 Tax=Nocardia iowensis TaxID=204891 RepID=A0ABX8RNJ0_NOCIO|nr:hypothetical protein [Nocardia iowensis]QXN91208.1 hypothetical protein KV110_38780 [Nocardia iowensis]